MFSIAKMSGGSEWYYLSLIYYLGLRGRTKAKKKRRGGDSGDEPPDDDSGTDPDEAAFGEIDPYTLDTPGEPPGIWFGIGALVLGLIGMIREVPYQRIFRGLHPVTEKPLVQNAGKRDRRAGFETCLSPPKDFSVLVSQAPPEVRERLLDLLWRAAKETLRWIERHYAFSRVGKASEGCQYVPVKLVIAMFEHACSRAKDPGFHLHAQIFNIGVDANGDTRTIESSPLFANQRLFTLYFRARLMAGLRNEFGLSVEPNKHGFHIRGVPDELARKYSKRRQAIVNRLAEWGKTGATAAAAAAMATRDGKDPLVSRRELFEHWRETNAQAGFDDRCVARLLRHGPKVPKGNLKNLIEKVVRELTSQTHHFTHDDLRRRALETLPSYGWSPDVILREVENYLDADPGIEPLLDEHEARRYTTKEVLENEGALLYTFDLLVSRPGIRLSENTIQRVLAKHPTLRREQADFVRHLAQAKGAARFGLGFAGTGKTFALRTFVEACKKEGYEVLGTAPTGQAARVLGREIGIPCDTLTRFLGDFRLPISAALTHHARQLTRAARRKRTRRFRQPRPANITRNTIVLADESGMAGLPHMRKLSELVERGGGTLCMVGDPMQLPAIGSVSPLQALARRYGSARLTEIHRQKDIWARVAAQIFAEGDPAEAMEIFAAKNKITVRNNVDELLQQACLDWTSEGLLTPHRTIILANTNHLAHTTNHICQEHRLRAGVLQANCSIPIIDEQDEAVYESRVYVGDRILFTKNSRGRRGYGVDNGSLGTVHAINPSDSQISVVLDDGRVIRVSAAKFPHIRLGYAMTTYKAQGASIPKVLIIIAGNVKLQNLPASYVQATRAIEDTQFYTTTDQLDILEGEIKHSPLIKHMSQRPDLRLASELRVPDDRQTRPRPPRIREVPDQDESTAAAAPEASPDSPDANGGQGNRRTQQPATADRPDESHEQNPASRLKRLRSEKSIWDAQKRRLASRLRRLRTKKSLWESRGSQDQADALERERLNARARREARRERRRALREHKAERERLLPQEPEALPFGSPGSTAGQQQEHPSHGFPNGDDHPNAASIPAKADDDSARQAQQAAWWREKLTAELLQHLTAADYHVKLQSLRRRQDALAREDAATAGGTSSETPSDPGEIALLPEQPALQPKDWTEGFRCFQRELLRQQRSGSIHVPVEQQEPHGEEIPFAGSHESLPADASEGDAMGLPRQPAFNRKDWEEGFRRSQQEMLRERRLATIAIILEHQERDAGDIPFTATQEQLPANTDTKCPDELPQQPNLNRKDWAAAYQQHEAKVLRQRRHSAAQALEEAKKRDAELRAQRLEQAARDAERQRGIASAAESTAESRPVPQSQTAAEQPRRAGDSTDHSTFLRLLPAELAAAGRQSSSPHDGGSDHAGVAPGQQITILGKSFVIAPSPVSGQSILDALADAPCPVCGGRVCGQSGSAGCSGKAQATADAELALRGAAQTEWDKQQLATALIHHSEQ